MNIASATEFGSNQRKYFELAEKEYIMSMSENKIKEGDKAKVSPMLTGEEDWIEGEIIDIENNPFKGIVIAIKDNLGRIFFGEAKYFVLV